MESLHPYPCRFPPSVPTEYLESSPVVLDPFCGSGTTLLAGAAAGATALGFDCNPIAVLISRFKLLPATPHFVERARRVLAETRTQVESRLGSGLTLREFDGRDHWFDAHVQEELAAILEWVERTQEPDIRTWQQFSLSAILNRVSRQDSETRYARVERNVPRSATLELYLRKSDQALSALTARGRVNTSGNRVEVGNVMAGLPLGNATVPLIVTSPPYANTMDYYLYHKQRMNVLGYDYRQALRSEIGSRREYSSLKAGPDKWDYDLTSVLAEFRRVLTEDGLAVLVIGDSVIAGEFIDVAAVVARLASQTGFRSEMVGSELIASRGKSFNPAFRRAPKHEHTIELRPI